MSANKSHIGAGYFTSRPPPLGLLIVLAITGLALFTIMSIYFAIVSGGNSAAIMMILFFGVPLAFIIGVEENAFPDLPKRKWKSMALFYVTAIFVIPLVGSLFISFNIALILLLIIFAIPMALGLIHLVTSEEKWFDFRTNSREKLSSAGEKIKAPIVRVRHGPKRRLRRNR